MTNQNNEVYRLIRTAYHMKDFDLKRIWKHAGLEENTLHDREKRFYLNEMHERYMPLSSKQLKRWLKSICDERSVTVTGMSVAALLDALTESEGVDGGNTPIESARALRAALRESPINQRS